MIVAMELVITTLSTDLLLAAAFTAPIAPTQAFKSKIFRCSRTSMSLRYYESKNIRKNGASWCILLSLLPSECSIGSKKLSWNSWVDDFLLIFFGRTQSPYEWCGSMKAAHRTALQYLLLNPRLMQKAPNIISNNYNRPASARQLYFLIRLTCIWLHERLSQRRPPSLHRSSLPQTIPAFQARQYRAFPNGHTLESLVWTQYLSLCIHSSITAS